LIPVNEEIKKLAEMLPKSFDWRNVNGSDYVSPVRNQGELCGSCYSFASTAMIESRIRIKSRNIQQPVLSPQDIIECSRYTQGCHGGKYLKYLENQSFQQI
jgi:cathepsin C